MAVAAVAAAGAATVVAVAVATVAVIVVPRSVFISHVVVVFIKMVFTCRCRLHS